MSFFKVLSITTPVNYKRNLGFASKIKINIISTTDLFREMYACLWVLITSWVNRAIPSYILPCHTYKPQDTGVLRSDKQIYLPDHWCRFEVLWYWNKFNFESISKKQEWWDTEISIWYTIFSPRQISISYDWLKASNFRNPPDNRELTTYVVQF